uniref:ATP-dependent DNA helicase n=2 Tax=Davidia involucrata TaxID=16924 RepID=A0A5B6ZVB9_DAVIN
MDGNSLSSDQVIAELIGMGFEFSNVTEAIKAVGPSLEDAVDFMLNGSNRNSKGASSSSKCSTNSGKALGKRALSSSGSLGRMRQSSIMEHLKSADRPKRSRTNVKSNIPVSGSEVLPNLVEGPNQPSPGMDTNLKSKLETSIIPSYCKEELDIGPDWEQKVNNLLQKHFRYSSLKGFQKEALAAWLAHQDCLVLAATGSGKSMCFQIPALLTGKVVVVVSPLISLMHDQCLKLAKHGVSACFLGSGQTDSSVEQKAMRGMYGIIYVCPETILRLIKPLQSLAESRGIALFAIDEVHCVSKWGHDFRPDYRRLSVLRENFRADNLKFLKFDIPLMALTATATVLVREDILKSLCMSKESKIVLTSFFRPNLRFSVKHSRTSSPSSYEKDFSELIDTYVRKKKSVEKKHKMISPDLEDASGNSSSTSNGSISEADEMSQGDVDNIEDGVSSENDDEASPAKEDGSTASKEKKMSVEYLEDECDLFQDVDDLDVPCGEFYGQSSAKDWDVCGSSETYDLLNKPEDRLKLLQGPLEQGLTIIYVPTRKETLSIAKFLCQFGVRAAAYNAKLPKSHLRQVHKEFHENALEVVVATIAFGMGIDKLNVRRIIHYGWPQSLEAYYQEAGRGGRDGKLADCVLYANLSRIPTLLPSQRSEDQTKQAYKMLSDCFRYGMGTSSCRAKTLVEYFGEHFSYEKCLLCDVCVNGPPEMQNLKAEADIFMQVIAAHYGQNSFSDGLYDNFCNGNKQGRFMEKPNIKVFVSKIRGQCQKYAASDLLWWRGLARILEEKGFITEGDKMTHVQIKFPEPTELGLEFLRCQEQSFYVYPEADMLLSVGKCKSYSAFSEWGKGWADPEIRRQRLEGRRSRRKPRKRKSRKHHPDPRTVRGRLAAKISKQK